MSIEFMLQGIIYVLMKQAENGGEYSHRDDGAYYMAITIVVDQNVLRGSQNWRG